MEPKTIGKFITTLRKANGMTQKELAEKLNVSDKTVSRWERDDGAPDLTVIPVIAEIFGVTCDELLRGERRSPGERTAEPVEEPTAKGEKQRKRILAMGLANYRNQTYLTMGISAVGLIAAMICNLGFLRAYIGFFVGAIFFVGSVVMQGICTNNALLSVSDESIQAEQAGQFRLSLFRLAKRGITVTAGLFAGTLPLIVFPDDTYLGLTADSWLLHGSVMAGIAVVLCIILGHFIQGYLVRKQIIHLEEGEYAKFWSNARRRRSFGFLLAILVGITAVGQIVFNEIWTPWRIAEGETFTDYDSFRRYMYEDRPANSIASEPIAVPDGDMLERRELWVYGGSPEGKLVCTYVVRNYDVKTVRASDTEDGLPVTAITHLDYRIAQQKIGIINGVFVGLYILEIIGVGIAYRKKKNSKQSA